MLTRTLSRTCGQLRLRNLGDDEVFEDVHMNRINLFGLLKIFQVISRSIVGSLHLAQVVLQS